ncbi:MAG: riboflavin synthase [Acetobacteraceae bacterium]|nr:riboflavin synthase [Acetobacteraceae bacterium]
MFTGIITALGTVRNVAPIGGGSDMRLAIAYPPGFVAERLGGAIAPGASVACSGCCLTAVAVEPDTFAADVSAETLARTTLGSWREGSQVNLERPLRIGDELGGHVVSGHVDGLGVVLDAAAENGSTRFRFRVPRDLAPFIAEKGSVAVDGVSLTVNDVADDVFGVNIIPHTRAVTRFATLGAGDTVNIEIDMLARYVARLGAFR